ncbi:unnamed protein product [Hymenolepis diminuta]|uniref:Uncharacterized protein n=1 Tax=Hymenolepis diminuta TaxID=6216 RepID=A0A564YXD7_HYMDI|nr:unnamed protein product [Hymenolepis diminuta]
MTHNLYLICLNGPIDSPLFYNSPVTSALIFSLGLTPVIHVKLSLFLHSKRTRVIYRLLRLSLISSVPHLPPSFALILPVASLKKFLSNQLLMFCSTIVVTSYSNSYELVTVVAFVRS